MVLVDAGVVQGCIAGWYVVHVVMEHEVARAFALWCWAGGSVTKEQFIESVFKLYFTSAEGLHSML